MTRFAAMGATAVVLLPADALAQGCAMCRATLEGSSDPLVGALNTSVLFMMAMPYALVATIGGWIFLNTWRREAGGSDETGDAVRKETTP